MPTKKSKPKPKPRSKPKSQSRPRQKPKARSRPKAKPRTTRPKPKPKPQSSRRIVPQRPNRSPFPTHLSTMTPIEIANMVQYHVRTIEGPIHAWIMVPNDRLRNDLGRTGPVMVGLGDRHVGDQKCGSCRETDGCYSLYHPHSLIMMLNRWAQQYSISTDLFLEFWKTDFNFGNHNSAMADLLTHHNQCTDRNAPCPFGSIRTHKTDVRMIMTNNPLSILQLLSMYPLYQTREEWVRDLVRVSGMEATRVIPLLRRMLMGEFVELLFTNPFFQTTRTYHEWIQLPYAVRTMLQTESRLYTQQYVDDLDVIVSLRTYITSFFDYVSGVTNQWDGDFRYLEACIVTIGCFFMDMYTVSRCLKNFAIPSQLSVLYQGAAHTSNINRLLRPYYDTVAEYGDVNRVDKCIQQRL